MADDDSSELSMLSSIESELSDPGSETPSEPKHGILKFFPKLSKQPKEDSPPPRKRSPSPAHEYVLADNPNIAFIVMFRSRFTDCFPKSLANFGPQELEADIVEPVPGERVENFLCALLSLILNRKQDVKPGHYNRALEEAIQNHKSQWAPAWQDKSPVAGGGTFASMAPTERLTLLRTLILWSLSSSDSVKSLITSSYKQNRHEDDLNQPLSVQPWGSDSDKRRYFLIEGLDDTAFRVYRESNPAGFKRTWWSVAGSIDELKALAHKLETKDGGPKARKLSQKMMQAIPRFEATEEKRKRREYRQQRKAQFKRPEPGFSMYEGRTRGKRIKYTFSDEEDFDSDLSTRRSARNTGTHTPAEPSGPVTTQSGRQVRAPTRMTGEASGSRPGSANGEAGDGFHNEGSGIGATGRPRRSAAVHHGTNGWAGHGDHSANEDDMDEAEGSEPDFGDDEEDVDEHVPDDTDDDEDDYDEADRMDEDDLEDEPKKSLIVKLSVKPTKRAAAGNAVQNVEAAREPSTGQSEPVNKHSAAADTAKTKENAATGNATMPEQTAVKAEPVATPGTPKPEAAQQPLLAATPLAFRGSPEKPHAQTAADATPGH